MPLEADTRQKAREIIGRMPRLASVPAALAEASRVAQDPESSIEDLAAAFARDTSLCAQLLKVANSAFYGLRAEVKSIEHAAVVLGRKVLRNVVMAATLRAVVHKFDSHRARWVAGLWSHGVGAAAASSALAHETGLGDPHEAFAAGLVHDVGFLVELERNGRLLYELLEETDGLSQGDWSSHRQRERESFGATHTEFGAALCEAWGFPETLRDVAAHHHEPLAADEDTRLLVVLVHVAETLAARKEHGHDICPAGPVSPEMLALLGLADPDVDELTVRLRQAVDEAELVF